MTYFLFVTTRLLLGLAWLLLLISMVLPQVQVIYHGQNQGVVNGFFAAIAALVLGLNFLLSFSWYGFNPLSTEMALILAIMLSDLLFIVSPLALIKPGLGKFIGPSLYWGLNVTCLVLFIMVTPQILHPPIVQGFINTFQPLPNLFLWISAQTLLTLAASTQLLRKYMVR